MSSQTDLARHPAVFQPGDPPRTGHIAFLDPAGDSVLTVAEERDEGVATRAVPATLMPVGEAVAALARARKDPPTPTRPPASGAPPPSSRCSSSPGAASCPACRRASTTPGGPGPSTPTTPAASANWPPPCPPPPAPSPPAR
ncbi:hypothetical protein [Nonomuraea salmonea]|uniref:hypothetical protein n=1 Tax=Nonomuraea salmonea TaxID=46181 RepID=UPI0031E7DBF4